MLVIQLTQNYTFIVVRSLWATQLGYVDVSITALEILFMIQVNAYPISFGNIHPFMVILQYLILMCLYINMN